MRELFFPFSVGAELVFAAPGGHRDTQYLAELIASRGITCCSFVPSQLEVFLQVCSPAVQNPGYKTLALASNSFHMFVVCLWSV